MTVAAAGLVLGFLLATGYGAAFHLAVGGPPRYVVVYVLAAWFGFLVGHFLGDFFGLSWLKLGAIHLLTASLGAWSMLLVSRWLVAKWA
jgi:hypothetical protein